MSGMKKTLLATALLSMGFVGAASAQSITVPAGSVMIKGSISVDNTGAGGAITAFDCDVLMVGRLGEATPLGTPVERITGVQVMNGGSGFIGGAGCPFVDVTGLPWAVNVASPNITIQNVGFAVHPDFGQPGCANTTITASWSDGNPLQSDPIHGALITMSNVNVGGCIVNGVLRVHSYLAGPA